MSNKESIVEQKTIGINIGTEGTFSNTELVDGKIQLKKLQEGSNEFSSMGFWTSNIIDIGDNFKDYGKVIITHTNTDNSRISVTTRSSSNSINFSQWTKIGEDGTILSLKNRYMQLRIELYAGTTISDIVLDSSLIGDNNFVENAIYRQSSYQIPTLTSNAPTATGFPFAESSYGGGNDIWRAFDNTTAHYITANSKPLGFIGYSFTNSVKVVKYLLQSTNISNQTTMIKDWVLEGSNDTTNGTDGAWEILDTRSNQVWTMAQVREYPIDNKKEYKAYRVRWSSNNGHASLSSIGELNFQSATVESVQLKRDYNYDMTKDESWTEEGSLHRKGITRDEWTRIDKLNVVKKVI